MEEQPGTWKIHIQSHRTVRRDRSISRGWEDLIGSYCYCATRELEKGCHLVNDRSCRGDMKIVLERCMDKNSGTLNLLVVFVSERCMDKISGTLNLLGARGRQSEEF
ncbi:hypothetical protein KY285_033441 [Solanum tuberosum]|nr:hypothetical protein KY285_033441 [Solanum tuberosum]